MAPSAALVACDVLDDVATRESVMLLRPEVVVHLAWHPIAGAYLEAPENVRHLRASLALFEALRDAGCMRFLTAGTCFEYDTSATTALSETSAAAPRFLYAACKHAMFEACSHAARTSGVRHAHLRFFFLYGPHEHPARLVPSVARALLAGEEARTSPGEQVRDFLHVDDAARAVATVLASDATGAINVGSGEPVRVVDVVRAVADACCRPELLRVGALPHREGDPMHVLADATRLRGLGWSPRFDLAAGVRDTVRSLTERAHG
jgi:nucleoside-diphosphate-sugar epimerase